MQEIDSLKERRAELLDMIESVTKVLKYERVSHEEEIEEMKKMLKMEMEDKADVIRKTEESLKNVEDSMCVNGSSKRFLPIL